MNDARRYDFELPDSLIAQHPLENRVDARLMLVRREGESIEHYHVRDLGEIFRSGDLLILNDTRVLPARLVGRRVVTGGRWQGLFLESDAGGLRRILSKTRGKIQAGEDVSLEDPMGEPHMKLRLVQRMEDGQWVARPESDAPLLDVLEAVGRVPLPHYIRGGEMLPQDVERYQTVFAEHPGSVAAPTAGLHFTHELLQQLGQVGIQTAFVTLHVGMGTFRPISARKLDDHVMHLEWGEIGPTTVDAIKKVKRDGGRVIAVGTTSVRVLETAALNGQLSAWRGQTDLFIRPSFHFRVVDGLLTNFHLPQSTLLVLVRTLGGDKLVRQAYQEAVEESYRFYSYGDAMLIL